MERIVLAYSGGLDTSIAIPWLAGQAGAEVVALVMDIGQRADLVEIRQRALALGALRCHVIDVREELIRDYVLPSLQADALDDDGAPLVTALSRPLLVKKLIEVARMEGANAIAHGCTPGSRDDQWVEALTRTLAPTLTVIAPARLWTMTAEEKVTYARSLGIPIPASIDSPYEIDANLWGRTIRTTPGTAWSDPPEDLYLLTRPATDCPEQPAYLDITFAAGVPTHVNGIEMLPLEMLDSLDTIAGTHGVGRLHTGVASPATSGAPAICEAPAAVVLHTAHRALQALVTDRALAPQVHDAAHAYAKVIDGGQWFSPTRDTLDAFVATLQPRVTGSVRLELFAGDCSVISRESPNAVLDPVINAAS